MSIAKARNLDKLLDQILLTMKDRPPSSSLVNRIEKKVNKLLKAVYSKYCTATLVLWGLRLLFYGYVEDLAPTMPMLHQIGFIGSNAVVNALKYGKQRNLGPSKKGEYERCLREAYLDHSDILFVTLLKIKIGWIKDRERISKFSDDDYIEKMKAASRSTRNIRKRWKEIDPLLSHEFADVRSFLYEFENPQKFLDLAKETLDPIWQETYGFRFSSMISLLLRIKSYVDQQAAKQGMRIYIGRIEDAVIVQLSSLPKEEVRKILDFLAWSKQRVIDLEETGEDPAKYLLQMSLIKYAKENRFLTSNLLLFWGITSLLENVEYDRRLFITAKKLKLTRKLNAWIKAQEQEWLRAYSELMKEAGVIKVQFSKKLPDAGEVDILGFFKHEDEECVIVCEMKRRKPGWMSTSDLVRETYYVEENPVAQILRKIERISHSSKDERVICDLLKMDKLPEKIIPAVIVVGIPLPYFGEIPFIALHDNPRTVRDKLVEYLKSKKCQVRD